ncbi:MAG: hypothetical protein OHK0021_13600 [Bryobacter sp.]
MNHDQQIENGLRHLLRPRQPRQQAVDKILAEVRRCERRPVANAWRLFAIAASLALVLGLGVWRQHTLKQERAEQELAARQTAQQLETALLLASEKITQLDEKLSVKVGRKAVYER